MDIDRDRIDEAILALLLLGRHEGCAPGNPSIGPQWSGSTQRD